MVDLASIGTTIQNFKGIFLLMAFIILIGIIVYFFYFYLKNIGLNYAKAIIHIKTQNGSRWIIDKITETKSKTGFVYRLKNSRHAIQPIPDKYLAHFIDYTSIWWKLFRRANRVVFLDRDNTTSGRFYYTFVNYYDKLVLPPSNEPQVMEFLAPVDSYVYDWAIEKEKQVANDYPAWYIKHPGLAQAGIFIVGMICMTMIVIVVNMVK